MDQFSRHCEKKLKVSTKQSQEFLVLFHEIATLISFARNDGKDPYFTNTKSLFDESLELYL